MKRVFASLQHRPLCAAIGFAALSGSFATASRAQTWASTSIYVGGNWSDGTRWAGGVAPTNDGTANVIFSSSNATNVAWLDTNWNVASVYFNSTPGLGVGIYSNPSIGNPFNSSTVTTLTVQGGGITNASSYPITINPTLSLARSQTWNVGTNGLVVYGISGAGNLTKTGSGQLKLASTQSSFTGNLAVTAGSILAADGGSSLGADNATVSLSNGAAFNFSGGINTATPYAYKLTHTLTLGAGGGAVTAFDGSITFIAPVTGPGSLTLGPDTTYGGATTCGFNFANPNTYAGGTFVGNGVTATVTGSQPALGTGNVTVGVGGALALASMSNLAPASRVILQESANTFSPGALVLNAPSLDPASLVSSASTGGTVALGSFNWTTALDFSTIGNGKQSLGAGSPASVYAAATLSPGSDGIYRLGGGTAGGVLTLNGADNVLTGPHALIVSQNPGGSSVNTGSNPNGVKLMRANDFTGGTTLGGGSLVVGDDGALGSGPMTFLGGSFGSAGGARTIANPIVLKFVSLSVVDNVTFTGPVDLNKGTGWISLGGGYGGGKIAFSGVISNGALTLQSGTFTFTGVNTFAGGLTVSDAKLFVQDESNLGVVGVAFNLADGQLSPLGPTLTVNRPLYLTYDYSAIATNGGTVTLNGPITAANSNITLTKRDAGTLILTNPADNVPMTVVAGVLQVDNAPSGKTLNTMPVTVNGGTLAGMGVVGSTSLYNNGHLAPGDSGPGTLTISSGLRLSDGTVFDFDLGTQAADKLVLSNAHILQFQAIKPIIVVNVADAGGLAPGQTYDLFDWGSTPTTGIAASVFQLGSSPVGGTFSVTPAGVLQFTTVAYTPYQRWQSTYFGSINNASAAPTANPAGDGINNLLKYALGLDPLHAATAGLPQVSSLPGYLTLTYSKPKAVTDIVYAPQFSDDLLTWTSSGVVQEVMTDDGTTQTVRAKVISAGVGCRFLRLTVATQ